MNVDFLIIDSFMTGRKICFILLYQLIILVSANGQHNSNMLYSSKNKKPLHFDHPFFAKVIIIDNRFDTTVIPSLGADRNLLVPIILHGSFTETIQNYIEQEIGDMPKNDKTLLIELRKFEFNLGGVYFFANAYYNSGDAGFIKFASMDTIFRTQFERFINGKAIDVFLKELDRKGDVDFSNSSNNVSFEAIQNDNVQNEWGKYPINNVVNYQDGIFEFYELFRKNQSEKFGITLKMREDSVYIMTFTDSLPDEKRRNINWLHASHSQGAISYGGKLYYMIQYPFCLPLAKKNNTFYFHIPQSLPNMYYLNLAIQTGSNFDLSSPILKNFTASLTVFLTSAILSSVLNNAATKSIIEKGIKDSSMRDCYIDLDTGIIKYF